MDTCGSEDPGADLELAKISGGMDGPLFIDLPSTDWLDATCTKTKRGYHCEFHTRSVLDTVATMEMKVVGNRRFEAKYTGQVSCKGTKQECDERELQFGHELPCRMDGDMIGVAVMPDNFVPPVGSYQATVSPTGLNTCDIPPPVAGNQNLRVEVLDKGTAELFPDGSDVPHRCLARGKGRTRCSRVTVNGDNTRSTSLVDTTWKSATSFEGVAILEHRCVVGADCSGNKLGELPCHTVYHVEGNAAAASSAN